MKVAKSKFSTLKMTSMGIIGWLLFLVVAMASSSPTPPQAAPLEENLLRAGPWGGYDGDAWAYEPKGNISHISIVYEEVIHSIKFTSMDGNGNMDVSDKFGCRKGINEAEIDIDFMTEKLNGISGTFDTQKSSHFVTSLSFTTNLNKTYGPFGTVNGTAFSLTVKDYEFIGFYGQSNWMLVSIGVSLPFTTTESVKPWGGPGGENSYDYMAKGDLYRILMVHSESIRSITFTSQDKSGNLDTSRMIGGEYGDEGNTSEVVLDTTKGEKLVGISGTSGYDGIYLVITSLKFYTSTKRSFGPFGNESGTPFSYMGNNSFITGFYGRDGALLDSMGIHVKSPIPNLEFGEWPGSTIASNGWSYQPEGGISRISITYDDVIYSIIFEGKDAKGRLVSSKRFGKNIGRQNVEIDINIDNEKLNYVGGTFDQKNGVVVITSLSFSTDIGRSFGPFGSLKGTTFSLPVTNGFISGFHGHANKWIETIGAYAKPTDI